MLDHLALFEDNKAETSAGTCLVPDINDHLFTFTLHHIALQRKGQNDLVGDLGNHAGQVCGALGADLFCSQDGTGFHIQEPGIDFNTVVQLDHRARNHGLHPQHPPQAGCAVPVNQPGSADLLFINNLLQQPALHNLKAACLNQPGGQPLSHNLADILVFKVTFGLEVKHRNLDLLEISLDRRGQDKREQHAAEHQ